MDFVHGEQNAFTKDLKYDTSPWNIEYFLPKLMIDKIRKYNLKIVYAFVKICNFKFNLLLFTIKSISRRCHRLHDGMISSGMYLIYFVNNILGAGNSVNLSAPLNLLPATQIISRTN